MRRTTALLLVFLSTVGCEQTEDDSDASTRSSARAAERPATSPGPDAPGTSAQPALRVVFLGTSLTRGYGLESDAQGYTARLQEAADSAGLPVRMVNAGVSGETSAGGLRRLDWVLEVPADVIVVELGANDGLRGQDPAALEENLRAIVRRARRLHPDLAVVLLGMEAPPNMGERYASRFRVVFPRVAEEEGAVLVPFFLEGVAGVPELNQSDRIHPTAEGHERMARNVWEVLEPVLRARLEEDPATAAGGAP